MKTVANMSATSYATWQRPTFPLVSIFDILWRLRHWGSSGLLRVFDYDSHCRTCACLLCIFVPPTTALINIVNSCFSLGLVAVHIFSLHVCPFAFMLLVTLIKISFVVSVPSLSLLALYSVSSV